ncbi:protein kinase domain protein [Colletotrichum kahawae]|uniref:Protein kinase domain protein n=1 Tax=Colletotrichum kahawae TaxID=34407 RepID=A0AAD9YHP1_COLKA|nr:protein kinase domain protein [Colletotrichum kahawae]
MDCAPLPNDIHTEFLYYLQSDGIRRTNFEGKDFYFPRQISRWLLQKGSNATSSRAARLFSAIYDNRESSTGKFFPALKDRDVERDPILFAILVQMECGHMLHIFRNSIGDNHLGFHNLSHLYTDIEQALKEDKVTLPNRYTGLGYAGVTADFERQRWAFHPALNVLEMVEAGIEGKSILPFFDREIINEGGTAEVHHHKIHVDLVESENLRQILEPRKRDRQTGIEYYEFAVKTYLKGFDDIYKLESDAFKGFNGTNDPGSLGVVTYLGEYTRHDRGGDGVSAQGDTRHIMLEFGEQDLDEYLADTYPPVLNEEIIAFWESLFQIANTLARIHQLEHVRGDRVQKYVGWHGDIKPDNILRVRGKFKLADFGFTRFKKSVIGEPQTTHMLGGTRTYGCVFSAVATWVVLGSQGYENYGEMRVMAHKRLRQRYNHDSSVSVSNCSDAFHDGTQVLPAVLNWHDYLRSSSRKADTITHRVLDLVESGMLNQDPEKRLKSAALCQRLKEVLIDAKNDYQNELDAGVLRRQSPETLSALLVLDKRAPQSAEPRSRSAIDNDHPGRKEGTASGLANGSRLGVARSSRVKKSERIDKILRGKIANREEVIESGYNTGTIHELSGPDETTWYGVKDTEIRSLSPNLTPGISPEVLRITTSLNAIPINQRPGSPIPTIIHPEEEHEKDSNPLTSALPDLESNHYRTTPKLNSMTPANWTQIDALYEGEPSPVPLPLRPRNSQAEASAQEVEGSLPFGTVELDAASSVIRPIPTSESARLLARYHVGVPSEAAKKSQSFKTMKIGTLDKDGLDLMFTVGERHNVLGATEWSIPDKFRKSLQAAEESMHPRNKTNMATTLLKIFDKYENHSKKQTLIILTDGLWEGSNTSNDVEATISDFIQDLKRNLKKGQLRLLTDMTLSYREDVIDWKPWDSNDADSLIVGSIDPQLDSQDPSSSSPDPVLRTRSFLHSPTPTLNSKSRRKRLGKMLGL